MIPLGRFELQTPIGEGGVGEVWRALDRDHGIEVAVKVLTADNTRQADFGASFRNEVRAVAALDHPGIVRVLDHGEADLKAQDASAGRILAGSPWLAMELAEGGSMEQLGAKRARPPGWAFVRQALLQVLDALAHAHARAMVHRDLKPANVLITHDEGGELQLKLTDFGLAINSEESAIGAGASTIAGTPYYMAPEQFEGRWRDYGPWTDLYALGCMAFELVAGDWPFQGRGIMQICFAHMQGRRAALVPRIAVPSGFEGWLDVLLQRESRRRFQQAADAAWALVRLGEAEVEPVAALGGESTSSQDLSKTLLLNEGGITASETLTDPRSVAPTIALTNLWPQTLAIDPREAREHLTGGDPLLAPLPALQRDISWKGNGPGPSILPPLPANWRQPTVKRPSRALVGAGLSLFGLRPVPMVGRIAERDRLWDALTRICEGAGAQALILRGPAGNGKSRLAEWLGRRAHEVGNALLFKAVHGEAVGSRQGIGPMVGRFIRASGLPRERVRDRCRDTLTALGMGEEGSHDALCELIRPASELEQQGGERVIRFRDAEERYGVLRRVLERLAQERPVVLWLDDVHWGADTLAFARHILRAPGRSRAPLLLLLTVQEEALSQQPIAAAQLRQLLKLDAVEELRVGPLSVPARHALVRHLLGLQEELSVRLEERMGGNPLFAVQLVGDWVQRGVLEPGRRGFRLRAGAQAQIPDSLHAIWATRLDRLLGEHPPDAGEALELAATLGQEVDTAEWRELLALRGLSLPRSLIDQLLQETLLLAGPEGPLLALHFAHAMLREALLRRAQEAGRGPDHHRLCAELFEDSDASDAPERAARQRLAAGDLDKALPRLFAVSRDLLNQSEFARAEVLLASWHAGLVAHAVPTSDESWSAHGVLSSRLLQHVGRLESAQQAASASLDRARTNGWTQIAALAELELGRALFMMGDLTSSIDHLREGIVAATACADRATSSAGRRLLGDVLLNLGDLTEARECLGGAQQELRELGDAYGIASTALTLAKVCQREGKSEEFLGLVQEATEWFERGGVRWGVANCRISLGDHHRHLGQLATAEAEYRAALGVLEQMGSASAVFAELNLAIVLQRQGHHREADELLLTVRRTFAAQGRDSMMAAVSVVQLAGDAQAGRWAQLDEHLTEALLLLRETHFVELDIAHAARFAAGLCADRGRAKRLLDLARDQFTRLGRLEDVTELDATIAALDSEP